ncbi:MAG: hypothetical protein HY000_26635 [Planctomycetes bacterium]|nr:hypothetical protein [Planctomycetota bacterium]
MSRPPIPPSSILEGPIRLTFGSLLVAGGVWLLCKELISKFAWNMLGRALLCLLIANLAGELIWHLAPIWSMFSYRNYSLWAILHCVFCLLLVGRVTDAWQFHSVRPVRVIIVVLCLVCAAFLRAAVVGEPAPRVAAQEEALESWLTALETRLGSIPEDGPVVLMAASGGWRVLPRRPRQCNRRCNGRRLSASGRTWGWMPVWKHRSNRRRRSSTWATTAPA